MYIFCYMDPTPGTEKRGKGIRKQDPICTENGDIVFVALKLSITYIASIYKQYKGSFLLLLCKISNF